MPSRYFLPPSGCDVFASAIYKVAPSQLVIYDTSGMRVPVGKGLFNNTGKAMPKKT